MWWLTIYSDTSFTPAPEKSRKIIRVNLASWRKKEQPTAGLIEIALKNKVVLSWHDSCVHRYSGS
jgi:hypothetical protein